MFSLRPMILQHSRYCLHHVNMTAPAVHLWRLELCSKKHLRSVDYYTPSLYATAILAETNVVSANSRVLLSETVVDVEWPVSASG